MKKSIYIGLIFSLTSILFANIPLNNQVSLDSMDVGFVNMFPLGLYGTYYTTGLGLDSQLNVTFTQIDKLYGFVGLGYQYGVSKTQYVDSFNDMNIYLGAGYPFLITAVEKLTINPEVAFGLALHIVPGDVNRDGTKATEVFTDSYVKIAGKINYGLTDKLSAYLTPTFSFFTENDSNVGLLLGYQLGCRLAL